MAGSPQWKVYRGNEYVAACKHAEDAAALASVSGDADVRYGHSKKYTVWQERWESPIEDFSASESYELAAVIMRQRRSALPWRSRLFGREAIRRWSV